MISRLQLVNKYHLIILLLFSSLCFATDTKIPEGYHDQEIKHFSEFSDSEKTASQKFIGLAIDCRQGKIGQKLLSRLKDLGFDAHVGKPKAGEYRLKISQEELQYWVTLKNMNGPERSIVAIHPTNSLGSKRSYRDCYYIFELYVSDSKEHIFMQKTKTIVEFVDILYITPLIQLEGQVVEYLLPQLCAYMGRFDLLEFMLNGNDGKIRKKAMKALGEMGYPKAGEILKARLTKEKNRANKKKLKRYLKKIKNN